MTPWPAVDNLLDLVGNLWYGLVLIAVAAVPAWFAARNHKGIKKIQDQVINGHEGKPPMRADIDMMRDEISGIRDELRGGFAALRSDITEERATRRAEDAAIRDEITRHHPPD